MRTTTFENISKAIGSLRPGMPVERLTRALSENAMPVLPDEEGWVRSFFAQHGFALRLDQSDRIGSLFFYPHFSYYVSIEGFHIGQPLYGVLDRLTSSKLKYSQKPLLNPGHATSLVSTQDVWKQYKVDLRENLELEILIFNDRVHMMSLSHKAVHYKEVFSSQPQLREAFDLSLLPARLLSSPSSKNGCASRITVREEIWRDGWVCGRPPGITSSQWPLSMKTGFALRHAFTLRVPASYRVQGESFVALSLFVEDPDYQAPPSLMHLPEVIQGFEPQRIPEEPYQFLWKHFIVPAPHSYRMKDVWGREYVLIWHTEDQFLGPLCDPPDLKSEPLLQASLEPMWLRQGACEFLKTTKILDKYGHSLKALNTSLTQMAYPVEMRLRQMDPNVGQPPTSDLQQDKSYTSLWSLQGNALGLGRFVGQTHFGGTLGAIEPSVRLSPYYLEIEAHFCALHGGSGVGQIDLQLNQVDWSWG